MCHRMSPLLLRELQEGLKYMQVTGRAHVPRRDPSIVVPDAYPGSHVPLFVPSDDGKLAATELTWGFPSPAQGGRTVFNTRIETALRQATDGRGMWAAPITHGRCIVHVRAFYEWWTQPGAPRASADGEASGKRGRRPQVAFQLAGHRIFLIACVRQGERFPSSRRSQTRASRPCTTACHSCWDRASRASGLATTGPALPTAAPSSLIASCANDGRVEPTDSH